MAKTQSKGKSPVPKKAVVASAPPAPPAYPAVYPQSTLTQWEANGRLVANDKPLTLVKEALFLNENAYETARNAARPVRKGLTILGLILLAVVIARLIGLGLGYLTTPRWDLLASDILSRLTAMRWYAAVLARNPQFAGQFEAGYLAFWQLFRLLGGYPSIPGTLASIVSVVLSTLSGWLTFGLFAHLFARWFGGQARFGQFLGALALAYAPLLLYVLEVIPGFTLPLMLVPLSLLITRFMAIKRTYRLTTGYALAASLLPYLVLAFIGVAIASLTVAFGLNQIPYINQIIRAGQFWSNQAQP